MSELSIAVVSITRTQRGRFFWAAWWTGAPAATPFRKPDAAGGGARSHEDALRDAERVCGRSLTETDPRWARAWKRTLRGMPPFTPVEQRADRAPRAPAPPATPGTPSWWSVLGVEPGATPAEVKVAFRRRALQTHPDHGGDPAAFRAVRAAYERALRRRAKRR